MNRTILRGPAIGALASVLLSLPLSAQITTHTLQIGGNDAFSCQGSVNPATLSDGVTLASAQLDFRFDASLGELEIVALNTSPVQNGVANPVLDSIVFNVPEEAVTGVTMLSQSTTAGAAPAFALTADTNLYIAPNPVSLGCFGELNVKLDAAPGGGIGNPTASTFRVPPASLSMGNTTFRMRLDGPGVPFLTARTIALQFSRNSALHVNAAANFREGGVSGAFGEISSVQDACYPTMWISDAARLGTEIGMLFSATSECHSCVLVSWNPGPLQIGQVAIPIGAPLIFLFSVPRFPETPLRVPLPIPNDPNLLEGPIYLTHATADVGPEFSERFTLTFVR